jgi:uncharacterized protein (TIGR02271 family)
VLTQNDIQQLAGATVYGANGDKIGSAGQVYLDNETGNPEWVTVKTGLFGTKESFVPLDKANLSSDRLEVPFGKDQIKGAPRIDDDGNLSPAEEDELYSYYGLASSGGVLSGNDTRTDGDSFAGTQRDSDRDSFVGTQRDSDRDGVVDTDRDTQRQTGTGTAGYDDDRSGTGTDDAMTRSEERLVTGTRTEEAGKARLRKYVVTEQQQVTVPVSREEVRLEREPITDANVGEATRGADLTEAEHEVTLRAERPVVETETVPVERVRLDKQTVTDQENVSGEVRKEQIEFQGDQERTRS